VKTQTPGNIFYWCDRYFAAQDMSRRNPGVPEFEKAVDFAKRKVEDLENRAFKGVQK
jgi:hypothetical protein